MYKLRLPGYYTVSGIAQLGLGQNLQFTMFNLAVSTFITVVRRVQCKADSVKADRIHVRKVQMHLFAYRRVWWSKKRGWIWRLVE